MVIPPLWIWIIINIVVLVIALVLIIVGARQKKTDHGVKMSVPVASVEKVFKVTRAAKCAATTKGKAVPMPDPVKEQIFPAPLFVTKSAATRPRSDPKPKAPCGEWAMETMYECDIMVQLPNGNAVPVSAATKMQLKMGDTISVYVRGNHALHASKFPPSKGTSAMIGVGSVFLILGLLSMLVAVSARDIPVVSGRLPAIEEE